MEAIVDTLIPSLSDEEIASIVKEEGGKGLTTAELEHFYRLSYKVSKRERGGTQHCKAKERTICAMSFTRFPTH